jgi:hypothetical protein
LLLFGHAKSANAGQAGTVTLISQERVLEASLPQVPPPRHRIETSPGAFRAEEQVKDTYSACLPFLMGCEEFILAESVARQNSLIIAPSNTAIEVQADGSVYGRGQRPAGPGQAVSRLTVTFSVDGVTPYALWAEGVGRATVNLSGPAGIIMRQHEWRGTVTESGALSAGTYTLTIEAAGDAYAEYGLRFSVGRDHSRDVFCGSTLDKRSYLAGDVVRGELTLGSTSSSIPVELKVWLRLPDGGQIAAVNRGADGSLMMWGGAIKYPLDLFAVDAGTATGIYELGCRLLNPVTGEKLDEHTFVFEVK